MRDVNIGRVKGNVSISDSSSGSGFDIGTIAAVVGVIFVVAVALQVAASIAAAVATILITLFWCAFGLLMAALAAGTAYVALRLSRGLPLRRAPRAARQLPRGAVHQITDAQPGRELARLHPDDLAAIASDLASRLRRPS
jgi:hypothetical protein